MGKWLILAALVIGCGYAALSVGQKAALYLKKENQLLATAGGQTVEAIRSLGEAGQTFLDRAGEEQLTILFTGTNESWRELDTLLLVGVDLNKRQIRLLEIPTDTYISRDSNSTHRISSVYADATARALKRGDSHAEAVRKGNIAIKGFVKQNMGIAIDHFISLSRNGLREVVDSIGGITVTLGQAIDFDDNTRDLHLHLSAGSQKLSGNDALALAVYRSADGKTDGQKLFLSALFNKIKNDFSLSTAIGLLKTGFSNTVSSLSLADLVPLAKGMLGISNDRFRMSALPTHAAIDEDGNTCQVLDRSGTVSLLAEYLSYQTGIDEAHFDKKRLFTSAGEIDKLYYGDQ